MTPLALGNYTKQAKKSSSKFKILTPSATRRASPTRCTTNFHVITLTTIPSHYMRSEDYWRTAPIVIPPTHSNSTLLCADAQQAKKSVAFPRTQAPLHSPPAPPTFHEVAAQVVPEFGNQLDRSHEAMQTGVADNIQPTRDGAVGEE
jgi:hypothetical protein